MRLKIDWNADPQWLREHFTPHATPEAVAAMQVAVYVMCGGGFMGESAASRPADFYIDARITALPYKAKEILQAVKVLAFVAGLAGYDPHNMPKMTRFHNLGIF